MNPDVVVDIGNTRIKWGRCTANGVRHVASLPPEVPEAWQRQLDAWGLRGPLTWAVSGVHPERCDSLVTWLRGRDDTVQVVDSARQLPLTVQVAHPNRVGIDRLLNAVAAARDPRRRVPAVVIDAGTAVTVDWVDGEGAFCGGAILPGLRLMARALHEHTALLPAIAVKEPCPPLPGRSTVQAIEAGVYYAVAGGINALVAKLAAAEPNTHVFLTGGDASLLHPALDARTLTWPEMTLEGLRLSVAGQ